MTEAGDSFNQSFSNEVELEKVMKNIYETCDETGRGKVSVSSLIDYITPYMSRNVSDVMMLKEALDPENVDPEVTCTTFFSVMSDWTKTFNQEDSFHNISPRVLDNPPLVVSTPRASFGNRQLRVYAEAAALNVSIVESCSVGDGNNESKFEKSILEDQIKELTYLNRKCHDELTMAKSQLLSQEEHTEILQNEIENLTKQLNHERDVNDNLVKESKTLDDLRETSICKQKFIDKLQKQLIHFEKENQQLKAKTDNLEHEKQKMEEKMIRMHEQLSKSRHDVIELQTEMHMKEEQMTYMEEAKTNLLAKICELKNTVDNYKESNHCLKVEKDKVTKMLQECMKRQSRNVGLTYSPSSTKASEYHNTINTTSPNANTQTHTTTSCNSPIPFASPIKTTLFKFFNKDSPYAKRCPSSSPQLPNQHNSQSTQTQFSHGLGCKSFILANNSPMTPNPIDKNSSLPNMYIVERSGGISATAAAAPVEEVSNVHDEKDMMQFSSPLSLMDELAAVSLYDSPSSQVMNTVCEACRDRHEIQHRLDEVSSQIKWLKSENETLRKSEEEYISLVQSKRALEDINMQHNVTIKDLTYDLEKSKKQVLELSVINNEYMEKVDRSVLVEKQLTIRNVEITDLQRRIADLKHELEQTHQKQIHDNVTLKEEILKFEDENKKLHLALNNNKIEREKLIEEYAKQFKQSKKDIDDLEQKYCESYDASTLLQRKHDELATNNATMYLQNQKTNDQLEEVQLELNFFTNIIDNSNKKATNTRQKLQLLLRCKDNYEKLKRKHDDVVEEKHKQAEEFQVKVNELEAKCKALDAERTKKTPHDRTQIKLEKMREKVDYLEEVLKDEKGKKSALEQEIRHVQRCNEAVITEKLTLLQGKEELQMRYASKESAYVELADHVTDLLASSHKLRYIVLQFAMKWKPVFDTVESISVLMAHLCEKEPYCSVSRCASSDVRHAAIVQSTDDLQTIGLILDALGNHSVTDACDYKGALALRGHLSSRPMSPDSPNLEALNAVHSASSGAGDNTIYNFDEESSSADGDAQAVDDPLEDLNRMYLPENLDFLLQSVRLEESAPPEVEAFVEEFALTFMFDCSGYKQRLDGKFQSLKELVILLTHQLRQFVSVSGDCRGKGNRASRALAGIVKSLFALSQSAEQFGAIQEEYKTSKTINTLIAYITHLSKQVDAFKAKSRRSTKGLSSETVMVDDVRASASNENRLLQRAHAPNCLMSLLNHFRPRNLLHLLNTEVMEFPFVGLLGMILWPLILNGSFPMGPRQSNWHYTVSTNPSE